MPDSLGEKRLVLIVGAPRSGTSWLQLLLTSVPEAASAFETHLFSAYLRSSFERWRVWEESGYVMGLHHLMSKSDYLDALRCLASSVLLSITKQKPNARFIVEKTPAHCAYASDILDLFPDAMFIHLVRDPRSVVSSLIAASKTWASDLKGVTAAEACEIWTRSTEASRQIQEKTNNYLEIKYEELLQEGPQYLKTIFDWVEIAISRSECENVFVRHKFEAMKSSNCLQLPETFFRSGTPDNWKHDLSAAEIALIESAACQLMRDFGYKLEAPAGFAAWKGSALAVTAAIRKRAKWRLASLGRRLWVN